jgi:CheY-like chemotaxis protein
MLAFARGGKYQAQVMNLNGAVLDTLRLQEGSFPPQISIERYMKEDLWNINADPTQMSQVVMNLCINASEAIEGSGRIVIRTDNIDVDEEFAKFHTGMKSGPYVYLSVEDTGCGMDHETVLKVFEPFFTTKFQGRGLGLAAVYGIVKNHDGYINVYSEKGIGTIFKVYIPATDESVNNIIEKKKKCSGGTETILLIDDDDTVVEVTRRILEKYGYQVLIAKNGQEAVDYVKKYNEVIHLAILDIGMPVMDGVTAFPLLREARPDMKIIVCSGYDLDSTAMSLLDSGALSFLQKPFKIDSLCHTIRNILDT